jgi:type II secretory pathway component PulF
MEHFFYLLSFLLKTKMSFMEAMGILVKEKERFPSIDSSWMYKSLQEGKSLGDVFHGQNRFPKFVGSFLAMSEQTSNLAESTEKIHLILKKMHEKNIKKSMDMMPNILLLIIGGLFLLLIVGIFLPIYDQAIRLVEAG